MMSVPRATVICLCHNQAGFVEEAINSVMRQTYPDVQLIVVDDASTDHSVKVIEHQLRGRPEVKFIKILRNVGNCRAFNSGLLHAEGEYIIDLAADDVLCKDRIQRGVEELERRGDPFGVHFTDAQWISEGGTPKFLHSDRFPHHTIPQGDIYKALIARFFICSPTVMFSRRVIDQLGGYDETLAYEDFDFWIRSSRDFYYCYTPEVLVKKRIVKNSLSQKQFSFFSRQQRTTFMVCEKILGLNRTRSEQQALQRRLIYEMRVCLRLLNLPLFFRYLQLYKRNSAMRYERQ